MCVRKRWSDVHVRRDGELFMCAHVYDVVLCGNTVGNVAVGL